MPGFDPICGCAGVGEYTFSNKSLKLNLTRRMLDELISGSESMKYTICELLAHELGRQSAGQLFAEGKTDQLDEFASFSWYQNIDCNENQYDEYVHECWTPSTDNSSNFGETLNFSHKARIPTVKIGQPVLPALWPYALRTCA